MQPRGTNRRAKDELLDEGEGASMAPREGSPVTTSAKRKVKVEVKSEAAAVFKTEESDSKDDAFMTPRKRPRVKSETKFAVAAAAAATSLKEGGKSKVATATAATVFGSFAGPTPEACQATHDALASVHGVPTPYKSGKVLDGLVRTILSQNTTDVTSALAFQRLKKGFPTWKAVLEAPEGAVEDAIRCGGLADMKAGRIRAILRWLLENRPLACSDGEPEMEYLRSMSDDEIKQELSNFKGVGPKTVACLLMFTLGRHEFPVDTHVWRITRDRLKWVPKNATRETTYLFLNACIPPHLKYGLHVLLVGHGKVCRKCASTVKRGAIDCPLPK